MNKCVLRPNGSPIYNFLSFIMYKTQKNIETDNKKILDCGAGGTPPPLVLFYQNGFNCYGIDISKKSLGAAVDFCSVNSVSINLQLGDMRSIPFQNDEFDYVYEHYSMCHLSKKDIKKAISEIKRVLKPGGYAYLGVISRDTFPLCGKELSPGEFSQKRDEYTELHSFFTDEEADMLVNDWEIIQKEKRILWRTDHINAMSKEDWNVLYKEIHDGTTDMEWQKLYDSRQEIFQYSHIYYILRKASTL